ncbi:hypothetical protein G6O67_000287 [Ophiocordyceps sinensis]|uniref:Uncharacterized protein n=2 Tax=Ophiocordyceps sinensis TaxID=72228 RepID=A0A8H4PYP0_9HYPO|nr:hypothetical protein OCS_05958 [Ophiocordyceps sinensis CO18]KAF4512964.1 hypothetical protein G6O67_000287 [Ophiocordyceps sinensis]
MAGSRRTRKTTEAASPEQARPAAATDVAKTAEERAVDRESLEDYNGDIQDRLIDLVSRIRNDEVPPDDDEAPDDEEADDDKDERGELVEAIVTYLERQAEAALPQDKMRAEVHTITSRFDKLDKCPAREKKSIYRKDTSYYLNQKRILNHRQLSKERKEESKSE